MRGIRAPRPRSNGTLFKEVIALLGRQSFHLLGLEEDRATGEAVYGPFEKLVDVHHLMTSSAKLVKDPHIKSFKSIGQLEQYASEVDDKELLMLMKISKDYGAQVPALVARIKAEVARTPAAAHINLMTAHRAKGLEFNQVVLTGDFEEFIGDDGKLKRATTQELAQELHLLYVGATRALIALETNQQIKTVLAALRREGFQLPKERAVAVIAKASASAAAATACPGAAPAALHSAAKSVVAPDRPAAAMQAAQPTVQLVAKLKIPRDFQKRALKDQVAHAIMVEGLLDVGELSIFLARSCEDTIRVLCNLFSAGQLSRRLFSDDSAVNAAADAQESKHLGSRAAVDSTYFL